MSRLAPAGVATVQARLARQRPRPLAVRLYRALLSDLGLLGAPARRRAARFLLRSLPAAALAAVSGLVVLGVFTAADLGWPQAAVLGGLALVLAGVVARRLRRAAAGRAASLREQLELGGLFVAAAQALVQAGGRHGDEALLQPLLYLVMAFLVGFLARPVGVALVGLASGLGVAAWWQRGAAPGELPAVLVHAGFMVLFALLYHAVLAAKLQAARQAEEAAVAHRIGELERRAEEFRRIAPTAPAEDAPEQERRAAQAAVVEIEAAVRGALEIAKVALGAHTCAVFLLSDDERELRPSERLSDSDALVRDPLPAGEGALGGAVRRRAPVRLHGEVKAASYYLDGTRPGALLAVPLMDRRGGHVRGAVVADRLAPRPFSDDEERLLTAVAAEILRAVAAERLMLDHRRSRRETEAFYQALEKLNRRTTARDVFDATLEVARGLLAPTPLEFAAVTLVERQEGRPSTHRVVRAVAGADGAQGTPVEGREFADGPGLVAAAVRVEASLPGSDLDPRRSWVFDAGVQLKGVAALKVIPLKATPLRSGEPGVLGTLVLGSSRPGAFDRETVRRLEVVAMQAGEAVQRARLFDETERLATTDGLTGLLNHRTFQARLDEHLAAAQRYGRTVALALCDIDHFKSVNDTYGHPVGDQVLKAVARVLAREARATDLVARYGGEEFAVVMPETDTAGARVIAERIRERVGALRVETGQGPLAVTLSLGVATSPGDGADKPRLVEAADGCLYHAKRHGRNQTVTAASLRAPRRAGS